MFKLSQDIVKFSGNKTDCYAMFADYYNRYSAEVLKKNIGTYTDKAQDGRVISLSEEADQMHEAMLAEIERIAGQKRPENMAPEIWASNPNFKWATFAVVTAMIETILPATLIDSIGLYTDMRFIGWGDVAHFEVPNRALMTVSTGANAQRTTMIQRQYKSDYIVPVYNHVITASVDLYSVLAGRMNLAEFARKAVISIETAMTREAYNAVVTGLQNVNSGISALNYTGAFDMEGLITMAQTVGAYNYNMKPIIAGTSVGLMKVLPDAAAGYRLNADADGPRINLIRTAFDYDFMVLPQVATGDYTSYSLALNDNQLFVISPAADKLVRGVVEGSTLSNSNDYYDTANLTSNFTINKRYGFEYLSGATAGSYIISG